MDWVSDIRMSKKNGKFEVDVTKRRCMISVSAECDFAEACKRDC